MNQRFVIPFFLTMILLASQASAATTIEAKPTQQHLAIELVESLGWSFGLPDEPDPDDYLIILNGRRSWRFEFEDIIIPDAAAPVAPKEMHTFGPYSAGRWQRAPGREVSPQMKFLLPISGRYEIKAALFKPGYEIKINGTTGKADGKESFSEVSFGTFDLSAGTIEAALTIPPRGGIDYLLLEAPPAQRIAPIKGWQLDEELNNSDLAVAVLRALDLESSLPGLPEKLEVEAESAPTPKGAVCCTDQYKGPFQGEWVKAEVSRSDYIHLFDIAQDGVYDLYVRALGKSDLRGLLNGKDHFAVSPKAHFTTLYAGSFYLEKGANQIEIDIPTRGGLDRFYFTARSSGKEDYLRLAGLPDAPSSMEEFNKLMRLVAAIGVER